MMRITWLQHRLQALISGIILVLLALFLLMTGLAVASYYQANVAGCVGAPQACPSNTFDAFEQYVRSLQVQNILLILPVLVGLFVGAPLLAREVEQGTYRLAWTQGVTKQRWLAAKSSLFIGATLGAFLLLELLVTWWNNPLVAAVGPFFDFDVTGMVLPIYALFALVLGIAASVVVRHSVGAMAITLALFVGLRVSIEQLRVHFFPLLSAQLPADGQLGAFRRDWIVSMFLVDRQGHLVNFNPCAHSAQISCLQDAGLRVWITYHPASQFWQFQGIESAIYLLLIGAICLLTFWWLRHRVS